MVAAETLKWHNEQRGRGTVKNIRLFNQVKGLFFSNCVFIIIIMEKTVINTCISPWALGKGVSLRTKGGAGGALGRGNSYGSDRLGGGWLLQIAKWDPASQRTHSKWRELAVEKNARTVWVKLFSLFLSLIWLAAPPWTSHPSSSLIWPDEGGRAWMVKYLQHCTSVRISFWQIRNPHHWFCLVQS